MLDSEPTPSPESAPEAGGTDSPPGSEPTRRTTKKAAAAATAKKAPTKKATVMAAAAKKATAKKATAKKASAKKAGAHGAVPQEAPEQPGAERPPTLPSPFGAAPDAPAAGAAQATGAARDAAPAKKTAAKRTTKKVAKKAPPTPEPADQAGPTVGVPLFQAPDPVQTAPRKRSAKKAAPPEPPPPEQSAPPRSEPIAAEPILEPGPAQAQGEGEDRDDEAGDGSSRRRRRRGGRRRRKSGQDTDAEQLPATDEQPATAQQSGGASPEPADSGKPSGAEGEEGGGGTRRRRRRRRPGEDEATGSDDPQDTVVKVRAPRTSGDKISSVTGSTRLEAKKQRRREGREAGRRRPPIVSEAEFLARRESVERVMVVRQREDLTQIAVLEDDILVEHYVARDTQTSLMGNVYLGRVQNVLPSMEAAFVDIGKGRNAILYAGEVNWDALGKSGQPRRIESALKSGQTVLVQVSKDSAGHKGARLTGQISLPGRYLVYVPKGQASGISRKLPDTERNRLKSLLKDILPEEAGVIIRTAAEGASEEELRRDVARLTARWDDIAKKIEAGQSPQLLYGEPDLMIKVVRDLFTEDFARLVVSGDDAWDDIEGYVGHVAPDLMQRVERWDGEGDVFSSYRVDEQIAKGLDRKVFLPSGGSLVIDRTEAMTVVDVNTGKFTGSGGNLEETVTKNNLEAADEIVRQLRLRDIGGIIVIDFIDMVLESNRDLVLRRLIECLGRDRTRHQVAEVTSLGLVQMTRKKIGAGLIEAFSATCDQCQGRGILMRPEPVESKQSSDDSGGGDARPSRRGGRRRDDEARHDRPAVAKPVEQKPEKSEKPEKSRASQPSRRKAVKAVPTPVPEPVAVPVAVPEPVAMPAPEPVGAAAASTQPDPPPAGPRRTRRRAASRPAGPAGAPVPVQVGAPATPPAG